jgi:lysozyme|tara:strand:+ start:1099 stop:1542 length:444 start_codon:yes stop_codon:yes gene_type:complete
MKTSAEGIALIKKFEGCELESYLCPADVWTIGYGTTKNVIEGMRITENQAEELLKKDLETFEEEIERLVEVPLSQCQFDSLVAWTYNLGATNLKNSTLLKVLNRAEHDEVPIQIKRWNKANGEVLKGLVRRREAEALLYEGKDWQEV